MNIVEPYARLCGVNDPTCPFTLDDGILLLRRIEYFGRISHRSEESQTPDSWRRFIETVVMGHGDWSIVEHASVTIDMVVDRGITHEWVRHRLCAFTQESTRFVNYQKKMPPSFIRPDFRALFPALPGNSDTGGPNITSLELLWQEAINCAEGVYCGLLLQGVSPQIARSVFPNALASRIATTTNLRNLRHIMIMRCTKEAHPQMRQVTLPLLAELKEKIPLIFDDIVPESKQSESMRRAR